MPDVRVVIPRALHSFLAVEARTGSPELLLRGENVAGVLAELARRQPQVHVRLCDERGKPRPHINVFVNDDHVRARAGLETPLIEGDVVSILPAVSGG